MDFEISSPGPIVGRTRVDGDRRLTLTALAMGVLLPEGITIQNPSKSPDVSRLLKYLENCGSSIDNSNDNIFIKGINGDKAVLIDTDVPASIMHIIISSAIFSNRLVKIKEGVDERSTMIKHLLDLLKTVGLNDKDVRRVDDHIIIENAVFTPTDVVHSDSEWAFGAVISAAMSSQKPVVISYPSNLVSHFLKLLCLLGFSVTYPVDINSRNVEISRRLARLEGQKSREIRKFEWSEKKDAIVKIPGDSTIAAAVCATASLLPGSDVLVEGIIWEQGRRGFFDALKRMKINIEWAPNNDSCSFDSANVRVKFGRGEGIHIFPDQAFSMVSELLILGTVSSFATGKTVISDDSKSAESGRDSFKVFAKGLDILGSHVGDFSEGIVLNGEQNFHGGFIDTEGKPDVALALTIAALSSSGTSTISGYNKDDHPVGPFLHIIKDIGHGLYV